MLLPTTILPFIGFPAKWRNIQRSCKVIQRDEEQVPKPQQDKLQSDDERWWERASPASSRPLPQIHTGELHQSLSLNNASYKLLALTVAPVDGLLV